MEPPEEHADERGSSKAFEMGWRELRIAPVMTGGTSLAVWIGGVTAELYRVVNRSADNPHDDVYGKLLTFTETDALVDIITGTSAGGLNGVMLAVAWALRVRAEDVVGLRSVWMELGSIDALLRSPSERHPKSLLRGDEYFWPQLTGVLEKLEKQGHVPATDRVARLREVNLIVTVTTLTGEPVRRYDDIGQPLDEVTQAQSLHFRTRHFGYPEDKDWARRLALAARSSASIPGVFEASYLPYNERLPNRPSFEEQASFHAGRWAMDGGVLDNKPIGLAMQAIFERPAQGQIRRVMLYVDPTPDTPVAAPDDDLDEPPTIRAVLGNANDAPKKEGISADLDRIRAAASEADRSADIRLAISGLIDSVVPLDLLSAAGSVFSRFRSLRAKASVQEMLDSNAPSDLVAASVERRSIEAALERAVANGAWLPVNLAIGFEDEQWPWGIAPLVYTVSVLYDVINRALQLPVPALRKELGTLRSDVARKGSPPVNGERAKDSEYWTAVIEKRPRTGDLATWAVNSYRAWPDVDNFQERQDAASTTTGSDDAIENREGAQHRETLGLFALQLAKTVQELIPVLQRVLAAVEHEPERAKSFSEDLAYIHAHVLLLEPADPVAGDTAVSDVTDPLVQIAERLVALHVLSVVFGGPSKRHQRIEVIEVSWRAPNALDDRMPADKLAGTEFSRLGAFVKPSWRANDWMWGRLDGAYQMILLLLDPARLRQLGKTPEDVMNQFGLTEDSQRKELDYLANVELPTPPSLPLCAEAIARDVQTSIAREELPYVYDAVMQSKEGGAREGDAGTFRRTFERMMDGRTDIPVEQVRTLLASCRLGEETGGAEVGQDMLTRSGGRAVAVAANAATGDHSGIGLPGRIAAPLRQVALAIYAVTQAITTSSKTGIGLSAIVFGTAAALIGMELLGADINVGFVFLASVVLIGGFVIAITRSGLWAQLPVVLALVVIALALMGSHVREVITTVPGERTESVAQKGDHIVVRGSVAIRRDTGGPRVPVRENSRALVTAGHVEVVHPEVDQGWKQTLFLNTFSVATITIWIAAFSWVFSLIARDRLTFRRYNRARRRAADEGRDGPPIPTGAVIENVVTIIVVPTVLLLQHTFFEFLLTGHDTGWRATVIDFATALEKRDLTVVIAGLVFIGIFIGLAWDRGLRQFLAAVTRPVRRRYLARKARV